MDHIFKKTKFLLNTVELSLSSGVLGLRSQKGFVGLISLFRLLACIGIGASFYLIQNLGDYQIVIWSIYLTVSLVIAFIAIQNHTFFESPITQFTVICFDFLTIIIFLLLRNDIRSEMYLLLLLPLVLSAHFLPRWAAITFTFFAIVIYGCTFLLIRYHSNEYSVAQILWIWAFRSFFLSAGTWLYRVQRSIPSSTARISLSPTEARDQIENILETLDSFIEYDTLSLQLIYKDRLLIVACLGFPKRHHIYNIEFPTDNHKYPNYLVLERKKFVIVNADKFPSFRDHIYHATHVKTWMGVPLLAPSTGEIIGILSIDSAKENAYSEKDAKNATKIAQKLSAFLMDATLGPAALTMLTTRESIQSRIKLWSDDLAQRAVTCKDDLEAASQIVKIGRRIFRTEDCSLYLLRPKYYSDRSKPQTVLHLVASSSIPAHQFAKHESIVNDQPGCGLTGYSVYKNITLNYSSRETNDSPYHGSYTDNLEYLESKRSKQVMIVPIRNFSREPIGALKIENKIGWPSENRFTLYDQYLFETFTHTIGVIIEGIRKRNYIDRQRKNFHHLRGMISSAILKPLDAMIRKSDIKNHSVEGEYALIRNGVEYVASEIDNLLLDPGEFLTLETEGLMPALLAFVSLLASGFPSLKNASNRVFYRPSGVRDDLPYLVKETFFDIGREALLNAIRHSMVEQNDNGRITLLFEKDDTSYVLIIEDNGVGFKIDEKEKNSPNYGVKDMRKEIQDIQRIGKFADLMIDSKPGNGTRIKIVWTP